MEKSEDKGFSQLPEELLNGPKEGYKAYEGPNANVLQNDDKEKKWVREPASIQDRMTLEAAIRGEGDRIVKDLGDPRFKGMEKFVFKVKSNLGKDSVVHYVKDPKTGELMDFKFKKSSVD